ncbi:MAG TPA: carboxypeptidase-like regulatory domain-containing protein [Planctomycetota bacterium]
MTSRRERQGALAIAAVVGLLGLAIWFVATRTPAAPAPATAASAPAAAGSEVGTAAATAPAAPVDAAPAAQRKPGLARLHGTLRDAGGGPVEDFMVTLLKRRPLKPWPPPHDSASRTGSDFVIGAHRGPAQHELAGSTTDADGHFAFEDLAPGEYLLRCADRQEVEAALELEPGEAREVELRLPSDVAVVTGTLWQEGALANGHLVAFYRAGHQLFVHRQGEDPIRCLLHPGNYELRIGAEWCHGEDFWFSHHALVVPAGTPALAWRHEVGGTPCDVLVRDEAGTPKEPIGIDVNLVPSGGGRGAYFAKEASLGVWNRLWLPAGRWRVHVHGERLAAMPEQQVVVEPGSPPQRLEFVARPGAPVHLVLRDAAGHRVSVAPELVPSLLANGQVRPCALHKETSLAFLRVPLGPAELRLADGEVDGALSFLPFEPLPPVALNVQRDPLQAIRLVVQRRAFVDVRACHASGREDGNACVVVFRGDRRVRGRDERLTQRWAAWLPAGDYRAEIDRGGTVREYPFSVGTRDVTLRLRP